MVKTILKLDHGKGPIKKSDLGKMKPNGDPDIYTPQELHAFLGHAGQMSICVTQPAPAGAQVKVDEHGVSLFWEAPAENRQLPVIAYTVERDGGGRPQPR